MTTEWVKAVLIVCTDESVGNALAGAIGWDAGDSLTFTNGTDVTKAGQSGKFASVPLKQTGHDYIAEFMTDGPWPNLNARGITDALIIQGKAAMPAIMLGANTIRAQAVPFLADNGWGVV
jgi:hypothetical protein